MLLQWVYFGEGFDNEQGCFGYTLVACAGERELRKIYGWIVGVSVWCAERAFTRFCTCETGCVFFCKTL